MSAIFWTLINATQTPNPDYVWLLIWMLGILRRPLSTLGWTWNYTKWIAGDLGLALVIVVAVVAVVFWAKRRDLSDTRGATSSKTISAQAV